MADSLPPMPATSWYPDLHISTIDWSKGNLHQVNCGNVLLQITRSVIPPKDRYTVHPSYSYELNVRVLPNDLFDEEKTLKALTRAVGTFNPARRDMEFPQVLEKLSGGEVDACIRAAIHMEGNVQQLSGGRAKLEPAEKRKLEAHEEALVKVFPSLRRDAVFLNALLPHMDTITSAQPGLSNINAAKQLRETIANYPDLQALYPAYAHIERELHRGSGIGDSKKPPSFWERRVIELRRQAGRDNEL